MVDLKPLCEPAPKDYPKEAELFLERHFGTNSPLRVSEAAKIRMQLLHLNVLSFDDDGLEEKVPVEWHSATIEEVELPSIQRTSIVEYKEPVTDTLRTFNINWHLQNCMAWELIISNRNPSAKW